MKEKFLVLLTCTSLEFLTAIGVSAYLLYLGQTTLAIIAGIVFSKVIVFHLIIDYIDKKKHKQNSLNSIHKLYD